MRVDHVDVEDTTEIVERYEAAVAPDTITHRTSVGEVCAPAVEMVALVQGAVGEPRAMACTDRREIFESAGTVMMTGLSVAGASVVSEPADGITTHQIIPTERTRALSQAKVSNANDV